MRYFFIIIFLLANSSLLFAQHVRCELTPAHQKALQSILQISESAPEQLKKLDRDDATNQATDYLHHYLGFIMFLTFEDSADYIHLIEGGEACLKTWKLSDTSPSTYSFKANIYFHIGVAEAMRNNKWRSLMALIDGYELIQQANELFPQNTDFVRFNALSLILFDQIPNSFEWLSSVLNVEGNFDKGFDELHRYVESVKNNPGIYEEALLYESFAYLKFSSESADYCKMLSQLNVTYTSPLLMYLSGSLIVKNHQPIDKFTSVRDYSERFPLMHYLRGRMLLNQLNDSCLFEFNAFNERYKGSAFKSDVKLRQAWWYRLNGQNAKAMNLYNEVHNSPLGNSSADRQASHEIEFLFSTNLQLIKARLLFDSGNFSDALSVLVNEREVILSDANQTEEYYYRLARIYHEMGDFKMAIENYRAVLNEKANSERYFSPQSAFYIAQIYFNQKQYALSSQFLNKCFELNDGEYKDDINRKALSLRADLESMSR